MKTAAEIAEEFMVVGNRDLELAILRHMEHHMKLAVSAEREACAALCDGYAKRAWSAQYPSQEAATAAENLAKVIRARSGEPENRN